MQNDAVAARNGYRERDRIQLTKAHPQSTTNDNRSRLSDETTICLYQAIIKLSGQLTRER